MDIRKDAVLIKEALDKGLKWIKPKPKIIIEENEYGDGISVFIASKYFSGKKLFKKVPKVSKVPKVPKVSDFGRGFGPCLCLCLCVVLTKHSIRNCIDEYKAQSVLINTVSNRCIDEHNAQSTKIASCKVKKCLQACL